MTTTHRHTTRVTHTYGFTACVTPRDCHPESHGGVCLVEVCRCGATRRTNSTGRGREERTRWEISWQSLARYAVRAYDPSSGWMGPVRVEVDRAKDDAEAHRAGCLSQNGYSRALLVRPDPESEGRCVDMSGATVWPSHGRSNGSLRWS